MTWRESVSFDSATLPSCICVRLLAPLACMHNPPLVAILVVMALAIFGAHARSFGQRIRGCLDTSSWRIQDSAMGSALLGGCSEDPQRILRIYTFIEGEVPI